MNAERLLAHYATIADAPDAITRLRRFILDLAVRGNLVPNEGAWRITGILECLEPLADGRLIHQGWSPQCESNPSPSTAVWGVLKTTAIQDGFYLEEQNKELPAKLSPKELLEVHSGDILITCAGPRARCGVACLVRETRKRLLISGKMYRFRANESVVSRAYLSLWLRAGEAQAAIDAMKTGSSESGLNLTQDRFRALQVRFGSIAEQRRIVSKVDELMSLCDRLEAARAGREAVRDRLAAASLARLNAPDPETFEADARFVLDALPAITARPDQIKALRQTILNLAVRGKLVPQDAKDEPASELLKRIAKERTRPQSAKKARRSGATDLSNLRSEVPLPMGWLWTNIDELALSMRYGTSTKCEYAAVGVPVLRIPNVSDGAVSVEDIKFGPLTDSEQRDLALSAGDLLMIRSNGSLDIVGRSAVVTAQAEGMAFAGYLVRLRMSAANIRPEYIWLATNSTDVREQIEKPIRSAVGLKNVNLTEFGALTIPLPPLAEQHRIVAKVDALMALCDRLEASLTAAGATRRRLLDALLAEALAPAKDGQAGASDSPAFELIAGHVEKVDFSARSVYVLSLAYERHRVARRERTFGHVKAQKILHLVEAEAGFDLGRAPIRDAAGPNDFKHMLDVEKWAGEQNRFVFETNGAGYLLRPLSDFGKSLATEHCPDPLVRSIAIKLIDMLVPMDTRQAEILATVYAAWNNLLIEGKSPTDTEIVRAAREDWHPDKMKLPASDFFAAIGKLRHEGIVPKGAGKYVNGPHQKALFN